MKSFIDVFAPAYDDHDQAVIITAPSLGSGKTEILYTNKKFAEMAGYERHECIGKTPKIFQGKETSQNAIKLFISTLNRGKNAQMRVINYRKNGEKYWCDISAWPVHDHKGELLCYFAYEREFEKTRGRPKKRDGEDRWWVQ